MKKVKRILGILVISMLLLTPAFAVTEFGDLTITTYVGENLENSGIRITTDATPITPSNFDSKFFAAQSAITIGNTTLDNSINNVSGNFSVLVRRLSASSMKVEVIADPLTNGTHFLSYKLTSSVQFDSGNGYDVLVTNTQQSGKKYSIAQSSGNIIKHQNLFTYNIPANMNAPVGNYMATVQFKFTSN